MLIDAHVKAYIDAYMYVNAISDATCMIKEHTQLRWNGVSS